MGLKKWKAPSEGLVKINVDGGCLEGLGSSIGVVFRGAAGKVKLAASRMGADCWSPVLTEAKEILMGVGLAYEFGFRRVVVESDSSHIIDALNAEEQWLSSLHPILDDIRHVSSYFEYVSWSFVHREGNRVDNELAHCLPWSLGRTIWFHNFPSFISSIVLSDLIANEN